MCSLSLVVTDGFPRQTPGALGPESVAILAAPTMLGRGRA